MTARHNNRPAKLDRKEHTAMGRFRGAHTAIAGRRASSTANAARVTSGSSAGLLSLTIQGLAIAMLSGGLFWLVWIYGSALRDPRYLDGWLLAGGMVLQLGFHAALKIDGLSPKTAMRWRKLHIFAGYLIVAAFLSHSDFALPDTTLEWALWVGFVLVTLSGMLGTYLTWSLRDRHGIDDRITLARIPARFEELAREAEAVVATPNPAATAIALPAPPHDAWIMDLYTAHLREFFKGQSNVAAHLIGSQHPLKRLTGEIDALTRYVDQPHKDRLAVIKDLVIEKDRLDFARVYLAITKGWLFIHVPATYALVVLSVAHVVIVYAYSSGAW